jgi:hypothetical protein
MCHAPAYRAPTPEEASLSIIRPYTIAFIMFSLCLLARRRTPLDGLDCWDWTSLSLELSALLDWTWSLNLSALFAWTLLSLDISALLNF